MPAPTENSNPPIVEQPISCIASLFADGDGVVVFSAGEPSRRTYRFSMRDVRIVEPIAKASPSAEDTVPEFRVEINPRARCLRSEIVTLQEVIDDLGLRNDRSGTSMLARTPTQDALEATVGKHISQFCGNGFVDDANNHCAHFVSHVLGIKIGVTCRDITGGAAEPGSLRVHELFANCRQVGRWQDLPTPQVWGLIFITNPLNVDLVAKTMENVENKHVGVFLGGDRTVYQYKNASKKVVKQTLDEFKQHYPAPDNALFFGLP